MRQPVSSHPSRFPRPIAWVDGRVVPASEATVPLLDDGFLRGDAVFDAMLVRQGRTHARDAHLERLRRSARAVGIRLPTLGQVVTDLLAAWGEHEGALKVIVTRGGAVRGLLGAYPAPPSVSLALVELPWRTALSGVKTLSYAVNQLAFRRAQDADADDALIVDDGLLHELPTGALCLVRDDHVVTPDPGKVAILDSITVRELARVTDVELAVLTPADLDRADEVFVVSAARPVLPVHAVVDAAHPDAPSIDRPAPGPATARLKAAFDRHIADTLDAMP